MTNSKGCQTSSQKGTRRSVLSFDRQIGSLLVRYQAPINSRESLRPPNVGESIHGGLFTSSGLKTLPLQHRDYLRRLCRSKRGVLSPKGLSIAKNKKLRYFCQSQVNCIALKNHRMTTGCHQLQSKVTERETRLLKPCKSNSEVIYSKRETNITNKPSFKNKH